MLSSPLLRRRVAAGQDKSPLPHYCAASPTPLLPTRKPSTCWRCAAVRRMPNNSSSGGSGISGSGTSGSGAASDAAAQQEALLQRVLTALRSDPEYRQGSIYKCRNGHVYLVGGCTNPAEQATCPACGASIGSGSGDSRVPGM